MTRRAAQVSPREAGSPPATPMMRRADVTDPSPSAVASVPASSTNPIKGDGPPGYPPLLGRRLSRRFSSAGHREHLSARGGHRLPCASSPVPPCGRRVVLLRPRSCGRDTDGDVGGRGSGGGGTGGCWGVLPAASPCPLPPADQPLHPAGTLVYTLRTPRPTRGNPGMWRVSTASLPEPLVHPRLLKVMTAVAATLVLSAGDRGSATAVPRQTGVPCLER
jgi:hypothetical protein